MVIVEPDQTVELGVTSPRAVAVPPAAGDASREHFWFAWLGSLRSEDGTASPRSPHTDGSASPRSPPPPPMAEDV